jgi:hypothetical protein
MRIAEFEREVGPVCLCLSILIYQLYHDVLLHIMCNCVPQCFNIHITVTLTTQMSAIVVWFASKQIVGGAYECPPVLIMNELRERNFGTLDGTTLINYNKVLTFQSLCTTTMCGTSNYLNVLKVYHTANSATCSDDFIC